jgi:hypothetical protein
MSPRKLSATEVSRAEFRNYRDKGKQFYEVMKNCIQKGDWDAAVLNGVHSAICLSDALTVFFIGKRSTGKSHQDASFLLSQAVGQDDDGSRQADRLAQILNWKHDAEYEPTRASEKEASDFEKIVERVMQWAGKKLPR